MGNALEIGVTLLHVIQQPARGSHNDIHAAFQGLDLFTVAHTAVDDRHLMIGKSRIIANGRFNLRSQFSGWFKDQHAGTTIRFRQLRQDWQ